MRSTWILVFIPALQELTLSALQPSPLVLACLPDGFSVVLAVPEGSEGGSVYFVAALLPGFFLPVNGLYVRLEDEADVAHVG
jgi:hypothetical protein